MARNGDVEIAYESFGAPDAEPLLLIHGAGAQLVMWPAGFIAALVERGFHVVAIDVRDDGLSTHLTRFDNVKRRRGELAYTMRDLTDDVIAVFDALGWTTGHVLGVSQGGTIAQATAIHHPDRVRGLISIMSNPTPSLRLNRPRIGRAFRLFRVMSRTCADRDAEGERWVDAFRAIGSPGYPHQDEHWREAGRLLYDRGRNPAGQRRQFAAVWATGDRRAELAGVRAPTLVVHGEEDPLCNVRAGRATADAVPGARFVSYPGMGHDLPRALWPAIADEIGALAFDGATPRRGD